jgi:hypothetical protein
MIVIRGMKHIFNMDYVSKLGEKEFKEHCLTLKIFTQLPEKERNLKIKEAYGNIKSDAAKSRKPGEQISGRDIHSDNTEQLGGDNRTEQATDVAGKDIEGTEHKTKVRKSKLPEQDGK